jgi:hypothetical protein
MTLTHSGASELSQLMEGTTADALIPEIVRRGFQDLLEAEVSALTGAQLSDDNLVDAPQQDCRRTAMTATKARLAPR